MTFFLSVLDEVIRPSIAGVIALYQAFQEAYNKRKKHPRLGWALNRGFSLKSRICSPWLPTGSFVKRATILQDRSLFFIDISFV
ncbi:hypothetical protein AZ66_04160 [Paenibacillus sp. E194]|nr:hypothetical protein AZ66_04160 [Paenibacillus sp. E194]